MTQRMAAGSPRTGGRSDPLNVLDAEISRTSGQVPVKRKGAFPLFTPRIGRIVGRSLLLVLVGVIWAGPAYAAPASAQRARQVATGWLQSDAAPLGAALSKTVSEIKTYADDEGRPLADLSAVYIGHSFQYSSWSKVYSDKYARYIDERAHRDEQGNFVADTLDYYQNWYINPDQTRDSIYERVISNRFFVQAQPWDRNGVVGTIDAGIGIDMHTYSQFEMRDYQTGKYTKVNKTSYFAYGSVGGKIKKYVDWDANLKFYPSGYRGGDLTIGAHLALKHGAGFVRGIFILVVGMLILKTGYDAFLR